MMTSCSAWIVATMSDIRPVRDRSSAAMQRAFADDLEALGVGAADVEHLVVEVDHGAAPGQQVAAPDQTHRVAPRRPVEGLRGGGPPVDDERVADLVEDREAPDLVGLAAGAVDAPEAQRRTAQLEVLEALIGEGEEALPLDAGLAGRGLAELAVVAHDVDGGPAHVLQALIGAIDSLLLGADLGFDAAGTGSVAGVRAVRPPRDPVVGRCHGDDKPTASGRARPIGCTTQRGAGPAGPLRVRRRPARARPARDP